MRLRHIRQGRELPVILQDNNYDFNFQASRQPPKGRGHILPGDELVLECDYQTKGRQGPTFGGLSTREEMCLGFILYYPRSKLADCRSLPTLKTAMTAFGIENVFGEAFDKLEDFLKDLEGREDSDTLQDLLKALVRDLDLQSHDANNDRLRDKPENLPLSEEDLLNKPFYTVEEPSTSALISGSSFNDVMDSNQSGNFLPSLVESQSENYRELLPHLLLSVKIKEPLHLQNMTVSIIFVGKDNTYVLNFLLDLECRFSRLF